MTGTEAGIEIRGGGMIVMMRTAIATTAGGRLDETGVARPGTGIHGAGSTTMTMTDTIATEVQTVSVSVLETGTGIARDGDIGMMTGIRRVLQADMAGIETAIEIATTLIGGGVMMIDDELDSLCPLDVGGSKVWTLYITRYLIPQEIMDI